MLLDELIDPEPINNANQLAYYGIDFSLLKLIKPEAINKDAILKEKHLGALIEYFHAKLPVENIKYFLKFNQFDYNRYSVQQRLDSIAEDWVVLGHKMPTSQDVKQVIMRYDLPENSGLGFVIHPVEFNDSEKKVICYFTFFDIQTKEVYAMGCTWDLPSNYGFTRGFGLGMVSCMERYLQFIYEPVFRR